MNDTDNEKRSTMKQYTKAQSEVQSINSSIVEIEKGMNGASEMMTQRYQEALDTKRVELDEATIVLSGHYDRLIELNKPTEDVEPFPYGNVSRKGMDENEKVRIIKRWGREAYLSMPV